MLSRRSFIAAGTGVLAALPMRKLASAADDLHIVTMESDIEGGHVWFDPIGLLIKPGDRVQWVIKDNVHTVAAYHPDNDNHSLRIPEQAAPWDSGYLINPGDSFTVTLTVPGVYDYFCAPHEHGGMVGRIVVGEISGPGANPFNYFEAIDQQPDWKSIPMAAQKMFPSAKTIMRLGKVTAKSHYLELRNHK